MLPSTVLGTLNPELFDEASGVAVSGRFPGRLYHINDSGSRGFNFFYTNLHGVDLGETQINDVKRDGKDVEDLTLGPCTPVMTASCLYIGNIGDNRRRRDNFDVVLVEEREVFEERTDFFKHLKLRFPDGRHDAEGLAVHPSGDLYLLTRSWRVFPLIPAPARLYKMSKERVTAAADAEVQTLTFVGELDLPKLSGETFGSVATSFDIAPDGSKFLVLTRSVKGMNPGTRWMPSKTEEVASSTLRSRMARSAVVSCCTCRWKPRTTRLRLGLAFSNSLGKSSARQAEKLEA